MTIPWIGASRDDAGRMTGRGHAVYPDTLNAALRFALQQSGYDPDAVTFPGLIGPVVNVKAFGAAGNGSTDDTTALQLALDEAAAKNVTCIVPPSVGDYIISQPLVVSAQQWFSGLGKLGGARLSAAASFPAGQPMVRLGPTGVSGFSARLSNMTLLCNSIAETGVYGERVGSNGGVEDVVVSAALIKGIHFDTLSDNYFIRNVQVSLAATSGAGAVGIHCVGAGSGSRLLIDNADVNPGVSVPGISIKVDGLSGIILHVHPHSTTGGGLVIGDVTACSALSVHGVHVTNQTSGDGVRLGNTQNREVVLTALEVVGGAVLFRDSFNGFVLPSTVSLLGYYYVASPNDGGVPNYPTVEPLTVTPSALTAGNNNNYAGGTAVSNSGIWRVSGDGGGTSVITGIAGNPNAHKRILRLINVSANNVGLTHNDAASAPANRILNPSGATITLGQNDCAELLYDGITASWRTLNAQL